MTEADTSDVIVIGGGPGGSTLATLVARKGHRVTLLEKDPFPRYQIGESLLPSSVHHIADLLGVREQLQEAGFVKKRGGTFRWGREKEPWTFQFSDNPLIPLDQGYAYQVERARYDALLLDHARKNGVTVRQPCFARDLIIENGRVRGVRFTDEDGRARELIANYVVDASGHTTRTARPFGRRIYSDFFRNVAMFRYFVGAKRLAGQRSGNILTEAFEEGWMWFIPLSPELTSVGAVIAREHAEELRSNREEMFEAFVQRCPNVADLLSTALPVSGANCPRCVIPDRCGGACLYSPLRTRSDYSYCQERFWVPGAVLVGDAACFVDPVFSSGVHLAQYGALLAARSINTCLRGDLSEERAFSEFERRYRREYRHFYDFLVSFYDMHRDTDSYYWNARKVLNTRERSNEAFVRLVGGFGTGEVVREGDRFFDGKSGAGAAMEKIFVKKSRLVVALDRSVRFFGDDARAQALEEKRVPLFDGGLVPSEDRLHWEDFESRRAWTAWLATRLAVLSALTRGAGRIAQRLAERVSVTGGS